VRWWTLLRIVTTRPPLGETVLMTLTGQATALLPLGELTRAVLLARVTGIAVGSAIAAVTVQELLYSGLLIAAALPGSSRYYFARAGVAAALGGTVLVVVLLTVRPVFRRVRTLVARLPAVGHMMGAIDQLQADTVVLFENWRTYVWLWISAVQALMAVSLFYFVVNAIAPGRVDWVTAVHQRGVGDHPVAWKPGRVRSDHRRPPGRGRRSSIRGGNCGGGGAQAGRQGFERAHRGVALRVRPRPSSAAGRLTLRPARHADGARAADAR
jgi:hypothetical protein